MKSKLYLIMAVLSCCWLAGGYAQCDETLVDRAKQLSGAGEDAYLVKPFVVDFKAGDIEKPVPSGNFMAQLNRGNTYRFVASSNQHQEGHGVLQLYDQHILLGSTYDPLGIDGVDVFEFECDRTKTYNVTMFFREGKEGCASGAMARVYTEDEMVALHQESGLKASDSLTLATLYTNFDNPLYISTSDDRQKSVKVSISQGRVSLSDEGYHVAKVTEPGEVTVTVLTKYKDKRAPEEIKIQFQVKEKPLPTITLDGIPAGGGIKRAVFEGENLHLRLESQIFSVEDYHIKGFDIAVDGEDFGFKNFSDFVHKRNWTLLRKVASGKTISFYNLIIISPNGEELEAPPFNFTIE